MRRVFGLGVQPRHVLHRVSCWNVAYQGKVTLEEHLGYKRTLALGIASVDTNTGKKNVVNNRKDAFAAHPATVTRAKTCIVQNGSLVQQDAATMDGSRIGNFLWVKVFKGRPAMYLLWRVTKNFKDGIRGVKDVGIRM